MDQFGNTRRIYPALGGVLGGFDLTDIPALEYVGSPSERTILEDSKEIVRMIAYNWAMNDVHQETNYGRFFDMLLGETDDRWVLPHYFTIKLGETRWYEDAFSDLAIFLNQAIQYDVLYEHYVKETRESLKKFYPEDVKINRLFFLYDEFVAKEEKEGSFFDKLEEGDEILGNFL